MLHRCAHNSGGSATAPPCSCGFLHGASFSILFPMSGKHPVDGPPEYGNYTTHSSSVDCTLSLGTPSTRQTTHNPSAPIPTSSCNMSSLCWDILSQSGKQTSRGIAADGGGSGSNLGGDPLLLARRCANCDTTSTPLWRNGPRGPKSLCNACGIRYKKEERRAAASSPSPSSSSSPVAATATGYSYQRAPQHPWSCYAPAPAAPMYEELRVIRDYGGEHQTVSNDDDEDEGGRESPYLSWRLNVVPQPPQFPVRDRPSLFQYQ